MWLDRRVGLVTLGDRRTRGRPVGDQRRVDGHRRGGSPGRRRRVRRVLDLRAQPALELAAGELVDHLDDGLVAVQGDRGARLEPGPLVGLQLTDHRPPGLFEVGLRTDLAGVGSGLLPALLSGPACCSTRFPVLSLGSRDVTQRSPHTSPQPVKERDEPWAPAHAQPGGAPGSGYVCPGQSRCRQGSRCQCSTPEAAHPRWDGGRRGISSGPTLTLASRAAASRHPQADPSMCHRAPVRRAPRFDPVEDARVPLAGHLSSCRVSRAPVEGWSRAPALAPG